MREIKVPERNGIESQRNSKKKSLLIFDSSRSFKCYGFLRKIYFAAVRDKPPSKRLLMMSIYYIRTVSKYFFPFHLLSISLGCLVYGISWIVKDSEMSVKNLKSFYCFMCRYMKMGEDRRVRINAKLIYSDCKGDKTGQRLCLLWSTVTTGWVSGARSTHRETKARRFVQKGSWNSSRWLLKSVISIETVHLSYPP